DWPTCFVPIDAATNPSRDLDGTARFLHGRFSIARDDTHVYVAVEVSGIAPLGDQPLPAIYKNNSISLYLDGDGTFATMLYDPDAIQIVIDHANHLQGFRSASAVAAPGVTSAVKTTGATFTIEIAVQASTFGRATLAPTLGFDLGFEGGDGTAQYSETYWFQGCAPPACGCLNGMAAPFCDARSFGRATLAP
ncbi:MAG: sugar-binding protein, partial [Kofleriaceae bacterium]